MNGIHPIRLGLPTIAELNKQSCGHNFLLMLRILHTSDLAFAYMIFKKETLEDIIDVCDGILHEVTQEEGGDSLEEGGLTEEERAEYLVMVEELRDYVDRLPPSD